MKINAIILLKAIINISEIKKFNITDKWLKNSCFNCKYTRFITLFYFLFSEYIDETNESNFEDLKTLNKMILTLVNEVNDKNYNKIFDLILFKRINMIIIMNYWIK